MRILEAMIVGTNWHLVAVILLVILTVLACIILAVEVAVARRFRELKAMFSTALNVGSSFDLAITALRKKDEDSTDRIVGLEKRVDTIDAEVQRLSSFHPRVAYEEK